MVLAARSRSSLAESACAKDTEERGVRESAVVYQPLPGGAVQWNEQTAGEEEEAGGGSAAEGKCYRICRSSPIKCHSGSLPDTLRVFACFGQAEEAQEQYQSCVADAGVRKMDLANAKSTILTQIRKMVFQCDLTLKAVSR